jgi:NAD(P)-dependent dehydrogenase (short-subunit alcohol dehydrogenase family)
MAVGLVTGGSRGLGRELAGGLLDRGWSVVIDARDSLALRRAEKDLRPRLGDGAELVAVSGDVTDEAHRRALLLEVGRLGSLDLLVNNASTLGAAPLPSLSSYPLESLRRAYEVNVVAPLALVQAALSQLLRSSDPRILNVSSDASVEAYEGWGGYGSSKAPCSRSKSPASASGQSTRATWRHRCTRTHSRGKTSAIGHSQARWLPFFWI